MKGFHNKVLHINLSQRSFEEQPAGDQIYTKLLGGKGLATHLLLENTNPFRLLDSLPLFPGPVPVAEAVGTHKCDYRNGAG